VVCVSHYLERMTSLGSQGALVVAFDKVPCAHSSTGTLQVRLLGCEQLLTAVPGRSPVAALAGSPSEGWLRTKAKQQRGGGSELGSE
jgi:hypothetical protein